MRTAKGKKKIRRRRHDAETIFEDTGQNRLFCRIYLRGKEKVTLEITIAVIAHNLRKKGNIKYGVGKGRNLFTVPRS
jgi:IS5 family transposase